MTLVQALHQESSVAFVCASQRSVQVENVLCMLEHFFETYTSFCGSVVAPSMQTDRLLASNRADTGGLNAIKIDDDAQTESARYTATHPPLTPLAMRTMNSAFAYVLLLLSRSFYDETRALEHKHLPSLPALTACLTFTLTDSQDDVLASPILYLFQIQLFVAVKGWKLCNGVDPSSSTSTNSTTSKADSKTGTENSESSVSSSPDDVDNLLFASNHRIFTRYSRQVLAYAQTFLPYLRRFATLCSEDDAQRSTNVDPSTPRRLAAPSASGRRSLAPAKAGRHTL
jgi:hypothetical protein